MKNEYPHFTSSAFARGIGMVLAAILSKKRQAWLRVFWNNYKRVPAFLLFTLCRLLWMFIEKIKMHFTLKTSDRDIHESVEIKKILWSFKAQPMDVPRMQYYLATHERFAGEEVLLDENLFLAKVFRDHVVFVDFGKPVHLHYTASKATFLWDEIIQDAVRLLYVPISVFHRVAEEFPEEDKIDRRSEDLTIIYGTGRCGSTLFVKIIEAVSKEHLVFSEITAMFDMMSYHLRIPQPEFQRLMLSTIRFLCKSYDPQRRKICMKPLCLSVAMARKIREVAPKARFIFLHRDPIQTALAHERAFGMTLCYKTYQLMHWLAGDWPEWFENRIEFYRNPRMDEVAHRILPCPSIFETCLMVYANHYLAYKEAAKEFHFPAIRYEAIMEDPKQCVAHFLSLAGLDPNEHVIEMAMDTLRIDSQHDRTLSQSQLNGYPVTQINRELYDRSVRFCRELEMPEPKKLEIETKKDGYHLFPRNLSALDGFYPFSD